MKMTNLIARLLLRGAAAIPVIMLGTAPASAEYTTTIQLGSSPPNTNDSTVQGGTVVVKSKTVRSEDGTAVTEGIVLVSYRNDGGHRSCTEGLPFFSHFAQQNVTAAEGTNEIQYSYIANSLGAFSFRGSYFLGGTFPSFSPCVDLTVMAANSDDPCDGLDPVVHIYATGAGGPGEVRPGETGAWSFTIKILNCTSTDLTSLKVQGGTSGWTTSSGAIASSGTVTSRSAGKSKTVIFSWTTDLFDRDAESITVNVNGTVPLGALVGDILDLSGAWSASYNGMKSAYTPAVTLDVID